MEDVKCWKKIKLQEENVSIVSKPTVVESSDDRIVVDVQAVKAWAVKYKPRTSNEDKFITRLHRCLKSDVSYLSLSEGYLLFCAYLVVTKEITMEILCEDCSPSILEETAKRYRNHWVDFRD